MGFIANINELNNALNMYETYLNNEKQHVSILNNSFLQFTGDIDARELMGNMWRATDQKIYSIKTVNNQRGKGLDIFSSAIVSGLRTLIGAWKGGIFGEEISDEKLAELEDEIERLKQYIAYLYTILMIEVTDKNGKKHLEEDPKVREAINDAEERKAYIEMVVNEIKNYRSLTYDTVASWDGAFSDLATFGTQASALEPTPIWDYNSFKGTM